VKRAVARDADGLVTLEDIRRVRRQIVPYLRETPVVPLAREASEVGRERLFLKLDTLQVTGAFKPRAAFAVMHALAPQERARGVVLASSGNFAQAFAYAGRLMGAPIVVVMLRQSSRYKIEAAQAYGAEVVLVDDALKRQPVVEEVARERGMTAIDSWEHPFVARGHGCLGLEILEQVPDVETVLVPVSSGGGAAGVATAVKLARPGVKVIGVQPRRANAAYVSLQQGQPVTIDYWDSIADGLSARRPGAFPFRHLREYLDEIVLIEERDIAEAFRTLLFRGKVLAEPAGVVAPAGFLSGKVDVGRKTVACVTGGNVTEAVVRQLLDLGRPG
jgi:threonine dehydratase